MSMRVVHLGPSGEIGGAERIVLECIAADAGIRHTVVTLADGPFLRAAEQLGARTRAVAVSASLAAAGDAFGSTAGAVRSLLPAVLTVPNLSKRLSQVLAQEAADIVHSHGIKTHVLSVLQARSAPVVWHLHDYIGARSASSKLLRLLGRRCALAIAVSESVAADARTVLPASVPVVVVHNGIDVARFHPQGAGADLDALSALPPAVAGTLRIGLPATFAKWKGHDIFLEALARLGAPNVRGYIIGAPVYQTRNSQWSRAELDSMIERLGLAGRVGFTGLVEDMPAAYRALDVVVHASVRPEPFGLVIAEALACGRPVIAASEGGAGELFVDGVHAVASRGGDASALAGAIGRLVADPRQRAALACAARPHAVRAFARERFAADLRSALSILSASAPVLEFV